MARDRYRASGFAGVTIRASSRVELREFRRRARPRGAGHDDAHAEDDQSHDDQGTTTQGTTTTGTTTTVTTTTGTTTSGHETTGHGTTTAHDDYHALGGGTAHGGTSTRQTEQRPDEHDRAHEGDDPHGVDECENAIAMVGAIGGGLADVTPDSGVRPSRPTTAAYTAQLEALDTWIARNVDRSRAADAMVSNHVGLWLLRERLRHHLSSVRSFRASTTAPRSGASRHRRPGAGPSAPAGAPPFSETSLSPAGGRRSRRRRCRRPQRRRGSLRRLASAPSAAPATAYIGSMVHNVTVLLERWGATVTRLPAELSQ